MYGTHGIFWREVTSTEQQFTLSNISLTNMTTPSTCYVAGVREVQHHHPQQLRQGRSGLRQPHLQRRGHQFNQRRAAGTRCSRFA